MIKAFLEVLCCVIYDSGYINKAVKTMSFPDFFFFFYFLLETHKTMRSFQHYFPGKNCNSLWIEDTSCHLFLITKFSGRYITKYYIKKLKLKKKKLMSIYRGKHLQ